MKRWLTLTVVTMLACADTPLWRLDNAEAAKKPAAKKAASAKKPAAKKPAAKVYFDSVPATFRGKFMVWEGQRYIMPDTNTQIKGRTAWDLRFKEGDLEKCPNLPPGKPEDWAGKRVEVKGVFRLQESGDKKHVAFNAIEKLESIRLVP